MTIVARCTTPRAIVGSTKSPVATPIVARAVPVTTPRTVNRPTIPLASPTCGAATRSGTYPWNGPCARFELNWSSVTNAATASTVFDVARPTRNTRSRTVPMAMYGLRRPNRLTV